MEKYREISRIIIDKIEDGTLKIGYKLPTENVLAKKYNVSRHTIRKALEYLQERGYIETRKGSGSFITNETEYRSLDITSFTENYRHRVARSEVLSFELIESNPELEKLFALPSTNRYFRWERLRYLDGNPDPIQLETTIVPEYLIPNIKKEDLYRSCYRYIEEHTGYNIDHALKEINAVNLMKTEADKLKVPEGYPAIMIHNIGYLTNGEVFEVSLNYHINQTMKYYAKRL